MQEQTDQVTVVTGLVRMSFLVNAVYAASARDHGLTSQQGQLLCVLMGKPHGIGELGVVLNLAKSSVSGLVDRSERNGLVRRTRSEPDPRAVSVSLTPRGRKSATAFADDACRRIEDLTSSLPAGDADMLAGILGRVVRANEVPVVFPEPDSPQDR